MTNPFRSARLLYRAVESPDDDALFQTIQTEPTSFENSNVRLIRPQSRKDASTYQKYVAEQALLGVIICVPPHSDSPDDAKPVSIGTIHLKAPMSPNVHRFTEIGIDITGAYQGKGYGTEAIEWALDWAFDVAGLHRVVIRAFEWNYGARRLYGRIGFMHEGTAREELWYRGRFWDSYSYGMLDREWAEIKANKEIEKDKTA